MFDIFIKRPVLATVVSLLIFFLGLRALSDLPVRQYPTMTNTVITITTSYPGADANLIQGFITQQIQNTVATSEGLDYLISTSAQGLSTIKAYIKLNVNPNAAMTEVSSKVNEVMAFLPRGSQNPVSKKETGSTIAAAYMAFESKEMSAEQITDYVNRVVVPKVAAISGVSKAEVLGAKKFSMRIWLDPERMAMLNVTSEDVVNALNANSFIAAAGSTKGWYDIITTQAQTDLTSPEAFSDLVVRNVDSQLVRIRDIATASMGPEDPNTSVLVNGRSAIFVGVSTTPEANPLEVVSVLVNDALPDIKRQLPAGLNGDVVYDSTIFIEESINEVIHTIFEAAVIVMVVIFLFMGSLRSVLIPIVTVPLSLIGVAMMLAFLGFSINLLTLLAMVLAIGLVVDDAIVVVENVHRHIEEGKTPFDAAIIGTREISTPVISMTITLAAVYAPIAFMGGITGTLFKEFALTLAGAVVVSGVIALTLSPMMCSKLLRHEAKDTGFGAWVDRTFNRLQKGYMRLLDMSLHDRAPTVVFIFIIMGSLYFLFTAVPAELAPDEDQGALFTGYMGPASANIDFMETAAHQIQAKLQTFPEVQNTFLVGGAGNSNSGFGGVTLVPWSQRSKSADDLQDEFQKAFNEVPSVKASVYSMPALPGADGLPIQFVVTAGTADYPSLDAVQTDFLTRAQESGMFVYQDSDLKFESPQTRVEIDRDKAGAYGVTMSQIGNALATMTGGNYISLINLYGRSYQLIPETPRAKRLDPEMLGRFYVRTSSDVLIPLSSLVTLERQVMPIALNQFNQLNAFTFSAVPMPGVSSGQALNYLQTMSKEVLPQGYSYDYAGPLRQFVQEGSALVVTFAFAVLVIFLVLAAQFESFRDPLVILVSVPLSICGALIPLALGAATMNIYTQIGLVTLVGLISKHGILICEVALEQQEKGMNRLDAVRVAAGLRLRPILMTTAAMVAGLIPLLFASGAGAVSRFDIAIVIVAGLSIGTLFTLFVLPVIYTFLATDRHGQSREHGVTEASVQPVAS